jgi:hypothetical protein
MATEREAETDLLRFAAAKLKDSGYTVILDPSSSVLPSELRDLRPDGIAIGKKPYLLIEVAREGERSLQRVQGLQRAIRGNQDWRLHLILEGGVDLDELDASRLVEISATFHRIRLVANEDARAALLMCWACLEALARALDPKSFGRPQTPGRIVERFASFAYIGASEAEFLRTMAQKRNKFVHGQLSTPVSQVEIEKFISILENVLEAGKRQGVQ